VKIKVSLFVAVAVIVQAAAYFFVVYFHRPFKTVDWASFEPRFLTAIDSTGFHTLEYGSCTREQVPLPLNIQWQQPPQGHSRIHLTFGFPDSAMHYKLAVGGSAPFDCFVRYVDSRATVIAVHARSAQASQAQTLVSTLVREFPGLTITLTIDDA
jgi:hypothetical protein